MIAAFHLSRHDDRGLRLSRPLSRPDDRGLRLTAPMIAAFRTIAELDCTFVRTSVISGGCF
jgi:hypothetical protein